MPSEQSCRQILNDAWVEVQQLAQAGELEVWLGDCEASSGLGNSIRATINSNTLTYRYVLPTQLVAKVADPSVDAQSLQAGSGEDGAFDARSIAHAVIVPFDQQNEKVLGGSPQPYINNPVRHPRVSEEFRGQQKNKADWDHLIRVLSTVQATNDLEFSKIVFMQVLGVIYIRLSTTRVTYPAPLRVSLEDNLAIIDKFLSESSGGDRLLAIASALFAILGQRFSLFAQVRRRTITTADASSGMLADLECLTQSGEVALVVEVKDKVLTVTELKSTMAKVRERRIAEIFVIAQQGVDDDTTTQHEVNREFAVGHNVYILSIKQLAPGVLALFGATGRQEFLHEVGRHLDEYRSDIRHRRAWAELLSAL